jgi:hypothetical protein
MQKNILSKETIFPINGNILLKNGNKFPFLAIYSKLLYLLLYATRKRLDFR